MSYERDHDAPTRGVGAIAARDHARAGMRRYRRIGMGGDPVLHQDGGSGGAGGGTGRGGVVSSTRNLAMPALNTLPLAPRSGATTPPVVFNPQHPDGGDPGGDPGVDPGSGEVGSGDQAVLLQAQCQSAGGTWYPGSVGDPGVAPHCQMPATVTGKVSTPNPFDQVIGKVRNVFSNPISAGLAIGGLGLAYFLFRKK